MLDVHALSVNLSAHANLFELARHPLHRLSEHGELASHPHYVVLGCHVGRNFISEEKGGPATLSLEEPRIKERAAANNPGSPTAPWPAYALLFERDHKPPHDRREQLARGALAVVEGGGGHQAYASNKTLTTTFTAVNRTITHVSARMVRD
jgi:hypothetical protein